ncbi:MAG: glutaredoxin family protein [Candidatus Saccharimonadales bacterium]
MKVTVYSTTTCPYCVMLKKWLDEKGVEYTDYMVDKNPYAAQMMQQSGQSGVPFTTIEDGNGKIDGVLGFDRHLLAEALKI